MAWAALQATPRARTVLDLGAGVGSVGLLCLLGLGPGACLVAVEAQAVSVGLCRRTVAANGLSGRVEVRHADLRDPGALPPGSRFELVTANPPFLPAGTATASPVSQRAGARLELRGDVFDYAEAAARWAVPGAAFVFCHDARDPRPARALARAGLALRSRRELRFREGGPPRLAVYVAGGSGPEGDLPAISVRGPDGRFSEAWRAVRRDLLLEA